MDGRAVAYKLSRSGIFDDFTYILAVCLVHVPVALFNSLLLTMCVYFLADMSLEVSRIAVFWMVVFSAQLAMSGWFRVLTYASPTFEVAHALGGSLVGIFQLVAGFLVTRTNIPVFMRWLYYVNPISWALRSLALNEFFAARYDGPVELGGGLAGNNSGPSNSSTSIRGSVPLKREAYLDVFDIERDPHQAWMWGAVAYMLGTWFLFGIVLSYGALASCKYDSRPGTQRVHDEVARQQLYTKRSFMLGYSTASLRSMSRTTRPVTRGLSPISIAIKAEAGAEGVQEMECGVTPATESASSAVSIEPDTTEFRAAASIACHGDADTDCVSSPHGDVGAPPRYAGLSVQVQCAPVELAFDDVRYTVTAATDREGPAKTLTEVDRFAGFIAKRSRAGVTRPKHRGHLSRALSTAQFAAHHLPLLRGVSGIAQPGRLLCLMGASGAGKTTLLDVLAGRKTQGKEAGVVLINGRPASKKVRASLIAYCEQTDLHIPTLTVEESLDFSARLRLDAATAADESARRKVVGEVMDLLELDTIKGRPAGSLSVGEAKRLTIGCELVANPSLLFLDEPTTGLDSFSAVQVMHVLRNVAQTGRTVVCTIHQPSYDVFTAFDDLLLLAKGGRQVYFGPIGHHCNDLVRHMESHPTATPRPLRVNPATWMLHELEAERARMDVILDEQEESKSIPDTAAPKAAGQSDAPTDDLVQLQRTTNLFMETFRDSNAYYRMTQKLSRIKAAHATAGGRKESPLAVKVGDTTRFLAVLERTFTDSYRDLAFNGSRFTTLVVLGLIFGLLFFGLDFNASQGGVLSMVGVLQSMASYSGIQSLAAQVVLLYKYRPIFYRERALGMYGTMTYYLTMSLKEIVYLACLCVVFTPIVYAFVGLRFDRIEVFFETLASVFLVGLQLSLMSQFVAASFRHSSTAEVFVGELLLLMTIFNGVLTSGVQNYKPALRWIAYLNPLFLVNAPLALNQAHCFEAGPEAGEEARLEAGCPTVNVVYDGIERVQTVEGYVEQLVDATYVERWKYYAGILAITAVYQVLGWVLGHVLDFQRR